MTTLNLTNQQTHTNEIKPKFNLFKNQLDSRKIIWSKLSTEKRVKWIKSNKDPLMTLAWQIYKYLRNNFFEEVKDV